MHDSDMIYVSMAHRDTIVRAGLATLLRAYPGITVLDTDVPSGMPAGVQVIVTDHDDGICRARDAAGRPGAPAILVVTQREREWDVRSALAAGVQGYLLQHCGSAQLRTAVEMLACGQRYVTMELSRYNNDNPVRNCLTGRETAVLQLLAQGYCNKTIARELGIGVGTVKTHVKGVFDKLGATARTHAVALATQRGLVAERSFSAMVAPKNEYRR